MKIYTKTGDDGTTGLLGGERVSKANAKIEAYGTIDELNAFMGMVRDLCDSDRVHEQMTAIQSHLFVIGSHLATSDKGTKMNLPEIKNSDIEQLEIWMDEMDQELPPLQHFILPGGHQASSAAQMARCVCRRAERRIVEVLNSEKKFAIQLKYINRLSDYLFMLSRHILHEHGIAPLKWEPNR